VGAPPARLQAVRARGWDAELVLFTPGVPRLGNRRRSPPRCSAAYAAGPVLAPPTADAYAGSAARWCGQLRLEAGSTAAVRRPRSGGNLLSVLLLRIGPHRGGPDRSPGAPGSGFGRRFPTVLRTGVAARFAAAVERDFARTHRVGRLCRPARPTACAPLTRGHHRGHRSLRPARWWMPGIHPRSQAACSPYTDLPRGRGGGGAFGFSRADQLRQVLPTAHRTHPGRLSAAALIGLNTGPG